MKVTILEGLPGVGKTFIANYINMNENINVIEEIVNDKKIVSRTKYFLENDDMKYTKISNKKSLMDRGILSTISYELSKKIINFEYNFDEACLHYLSGKPDYQLMTRFMYPNLKLERIKK